jgi:phospholipase C
MHPASRKRVRRIVTGLLAVAATTGSLLASTAGTPASAASGDPATATPIKHVVVLYDENVSFDHYFGTYPQAANTDGTTFTAASGTPSATNLLSNNSALLGNNPNEYNPRRLGPAQAITCDQNHSYAPEQKADDNGKMDAFVQNTSSDVCTGQYGAPGLTMNYYDGNTVTAEWNYAQNFAMSDNSFGSSFGPSTPGAFNLVSGNTHGVTSVDSVTGAQTSTPAGFVRSPNSSGVGTLYGDNDPAYDDCSDSNHTSTNALAAMSGQNIGDLLNQKSVTWGWFQGGFKPTSTNAQGLAVCGASHANVGGASSADYSPHHNPFEYYKSTSNPHHLPPSSTAAIGSTDQANHEYDLSDFDTSLAAGNLPSVSFLKAAEYQDGHASYSDPTDEQNFLIKEINAIQKSKFWPSTAIVVAYDDSDGWYDQVAAAISNGSNDQNSDGQGDTSMCSNVTTIAGGYSDRCGPGPRLPLLVISPYAKQNYVDHTLTTQSSILRFIEDNWGTGRIGDGSFDATAGTIQNMFDFANPQQREVLLAADGSVALTPPVTVTPPANTAPAITSASSTTFTSGLAHSFTVQSSGLPTSALTETGALPTGVKFLDNGDGTATLSGTASGLAVGSYPITITAANGAGTNATQAFTVTVLGQSPSPTTSVLAGNLTDASTGEAVANVCAYLYPVGNSTSAAYATCTLPNGSYEIDSVKPGSYDVAFYDPTSVYATQWYTGTDGGAATQSGATAITLTAAKATTDIDGDLAVVSAGNLSGTVTDAASGNSAAGVCVYLYQAGNTSSASYATCTGSDGSYQLSGITPGSYDVAFYDPNSVYNTQWYTGTTGGASSQAAAKAITVPGGNRSLTGVGAALTTVAAGNLTGTLTDSSGNPAAGVCVYLYPHGDGSAAKYASCTQADGTYAIYGATPGAYDVAFSDPNSVYVTQWYNPAGGSATQAGAAGVTIAGGNQTASGINAQLTTVPAGNVTGKVTDATTGQALANVCVFLYAHGDNSAAKYATCTQADGSYGLFGVTPGSYDVAFFDPNFDHALQWYDGSATGAAGQSGAQPIAVPGGNHTLSGINAALAAS